MIQKKSVNTCWPFQITANRRPIPHHPASPRKIMIKAVKVNESCYDLHYGNSDIGTAEKAEDGYFYWWTQECDGHSGAWPFAVLHAIATTLESLNREWDNTVNDNLGRLARFKCHCGEPFTERVWHCPLCHHHWLMKDRECRNCHKVELF